MNKWISEYLNAWIDGSIEDQMEGEWTIDESMGELSTWP